MFNLNRIYNLDCMEAMKEIPDNFFQLAIWDKEPPPPEYFRELERVSENQIIFGGNYFAPMLNRGTKGWLVWDKGQHGLSQSDCELAYSSFDLPNMKFSIKALDDALFTEEPGKEGDAE